MSTIAPLIEVTQLAAQLGRRDLLVVDCRFDLADTSAGQRGYDEGHIPGAVYVHLDRDLSGPITASSGRHPLPEPAAFATLLGRLGVTPATRIVAYDQGPGATAARLWWMLRAVGHLAAQVLDGGFAAWRAAGLAASREAAQPHASTIVPARPFLGSLSTDAVRRGLQEQSLLLVDARAADRFGGMNERIDVVAGHVPGAINHPFTGNLGAEGRFLPPAVLAQHWRAVLGDRPATAAAMMCGSGVTACHNLLALESAGLPGAKLYAGSWSEWIRDPSRPVAT